MVYRAKSQRLLILSLFIFIILNDLIDYGGAYSLLLFGAFALLLIPLQFRFRINKDHLVYQILFFNLSIFKKEVYPNQIVKLKFTRIGWAKKCTLIHMKKGINIRIADFEPKDILVQLINFANTNNIAVDKTKDYLIIEKLKTDAN
ncbi:hypothetical protein [Virgibacillus sp. DJP39]|uniref:hypothetical protein n=1 Tax=Virgibacillus sp. DJP39 TaxID=3409790 RepID=UPI003BB647B7